MLKFWQVYGDHHDQLVEKLNQMARDKVLINGELRPIENGFIKRGIHSSVFKGRTISMPNTLKIVVNTVFVILFQAYAIGIIWKWR